MERSLRIQRALVGVWMLLGIGILYALAVENHSLFQTVAMVAIVVGVTQSALGIGTRK